MSTRTAPGGKGPSGDARVADKSLGQRRLAHPGFAYEDTSSRFERGRETFQSLANFGTAIQDSIAEILIGTQSLLDVRLFRGREEVGLVENQAGPKGLKLRYGKP